ncbi:alanyl-tRNA synthetase [Buchnera aphidicola (Schlechtendalia chinensis)]|uniref:Alanine--tRNA ligase n=1 Tax=Buchnera aphidicola subsp. Schlechtendalia chinensis TaxID=118110 RepID=A0A172WDT1_BUCSC|nr:alanine--tRNA ligase [Buchnera aphidicola]ANF17134.1 alanyl-tRNA synthetase [Buchnera aphidicola (Schlechtendalia chinensis)]
MKKTTDEIREMFLCFFKEKKHIILPGSSLIPENDSSLLFTNSGMNQFKKLFLEKTVNPQYTRVTTTQNCLRTGGKHNDFKNVGYTSKHHTLFEMLGNFSFGDYFKKEAIIYAWEFLTSKIWLNLPKKNLWVTIYEHDLESYNIWKNIIKIEKEKIIKIGNKNKQKYTSENFWQMSDTGPCGPSTEIFYDKGNNLFGKPPGNNSNNGIRFIEIWNIVFMQFNKLNNGNIVKLSRHAIDTGMGLERVAAIMQNVTSNYEIDLFQPTINLIVKMSQTNNLNNIHINIIADHIRSSSFIISENIVPSNEKHGYVLRRIIRRAIQHGHKLGIKSLFLHKLVPTLINSMGIYKPILEKKQKQIESILQLEESKFINTLEKGLKLLEIEISKLKNNVLKGEIAFKLYDTFGFPIDLTTEICHEKKISVDMLEFKKNLKNQKKKAKKAQFFINDTGITIPRKNSISSNFIGYNIKTSKSSITNIIFDNTYLQTVPKDKHKKGMLILDNTPFYPELGGQIGDIGEIYNTNGIFAVYDTQKFGDVIGHIGKLISGNLSINDIVHATIDSGRRSMIQSNHSATHLLNSSLRNILGNHIFQKGSYITNQFLRFDFSHHSSINLQNIQKIESVVNEKINQNILVKTEIMEFKEAKNKNIIAIFQEKYGEKVRVLSIDNFSIELCCGTHVKRTGDIGLFKIISEKSVSSGIRRIEAVTGKIAISIIHKKENELEDIATILKTKSKNVKDNIQKIISKNKELEQKLKNLYTKENRKLVNKLANNCVIVKNVNVIMQTFSNKDSKTLRNIIDQLKNKLKSAIIILVNIFEDHAIFIIGITSNVSKKISASKLLNIFLKKLNGKGGGKDVIAEGSVKNLIALREEITNIKNWISSNL